MARKRNVLLDESDLDSSSNSDDDEIEFNDRDLQDEHSLFDDPYQLKRGKRRKKNNYKSQSIYGVFDNDNQELENSSKKSDKRLSRPQVFVKSSATTSETKQESAQNDEIVTSSGPDSEDSDTSNPDENLSDQKIREDDEEEEEANPLEPSQGGTSAKIGVGHSKPGLGTSASNSDFRALLQAGTQSNIRLGSRGSKASSTKISSGIGFASFSESGVATEASAQNDDEKSVPRRSFLGVQPSDINQPVQTKKPISKTEQKHFEKLARDKTSSVALKMLQKMGWKTGTGLGMQAEGIVTPIESKARPKGMGLSYQGFEEKTEQAKEEARRSGKLVDSQDNRSQLQKKSKASHSAREAWKSKPKTQRKAKVVSKTYEQIISEFAKDSENAFIDPDVGEIIDLTGRKLPNLNTTLTGHYKGPTLDEKEHRLPELMHNLSLICDMAKGNLLHLVKEGQAIRQKHEHLEKSQKTSEALLKIQQQNLANIKKIVNLSNQTKVTYLKILDSIVDTTTAGEICEMISQFDDSFYELMGFFSDVQSLEYESLKLDEIVVCALAPILRQIWNRWHVLKQPDLSVTELKRYKKCFRLANNAEVLRDEVEQDIYQHPLFNNVYDTPTIRSTNRKMSAFECLIWNDWLPKIRSTVNNWSPYQCYDMLSVYTSWKPILPQFVHDNFLDQLIIPKLISCIENWDFIERPGQFHSTRKGSSRVSLHLFVFPWLEHIDSYRGGLLLAEVKLKLANWLKSWKYTSAESVEEKLMLQDLLVWKQDVYKRRDWDKMMLKTVAPNLSTYLHSNMTINPKKQELRPFEVMLDWCQLISNEEMLTQLLTAQFFSKWMETLWIWLASPAANAEQIAQWYNWWKSLFPDHLQEASVVNLGFARGQELMNEAHSLASVGADLKTKLPRPDLAKRPLVTVRSKNYESPGHQSQTNKLQKNSARTTEVTFRSIVEEEATKMNLFVIPLGKSLQSNGMSLFRVSNQYDGKSGLIISISDDVVFIKQKDNQTGKEEWEPILVEDMLKQAANL
ncbi:hypothetical protein O181_029848 [Austropuccinia psidii MF-1]|uniref:G-patch domain-containing protein n=1 Tax=Austropuccinia psidii MF-1 TaxID=1389203 RepID=A0A9Q3H343_9BASI|nr:hypothetical protein [Austropuccinia psidii MF-1]